MPAASPAASPSSGSSFVVTSAAAAAAAEEQQELPDFTASTSSGCAAAVLAPAEPLPDLEAPSPAPAPAKPKARSTAAAVHTRQPLPRELRIPPETSAAAAARPTSMFSETTVWAGTIPIVLRSDQAGVVWLHWQGRCVFIYKLSRFPFPGPIANAIPEK